MLAALLLGASLRDIRWNDLAAVEWGAEEPDTRPYLRREITAEPTLNHGERQQERERPEEHFLEPTRART